MAHLYIEPTLRSFGIIEDERPAAFTERHHFCLPIVSLTATDWLEREIDAYPVSSVILGMTRGLPGRRQLQLARHALQRGHRAFLYWPTENAIEVVDRQRLSRLWRHWFAYNLGKHMLRIVAGANTKRFPKLACSLEATTENLLKTLSAPLDFVVLDFECTKAHVLGGFAEIRRLTGVIGQIDDRLGDLPVQLEAQKVPKDLQTELLRTASEVTVVRKSIDTLQPNTDRGEAELNRVGESLGKLRELAQRSNISITTGSNLWQRLLAYNPAKRWLPIVAGQNGTQHTVPARFSGSMVGSIIESLRPMLYSVIIDFEKTKTHTFHEIADIRRLGEVIGRIDDKFRRLFEQLEERKILKILGSSCFRIVSDISVVRQLMESLQLYMAGAETALNRVGKNLHDLRHLTQQMDNLSLITTSESATPTNAFCRELARFHEAVLAVPFPPLARHPSRDMPIPGTGVYVRTDYWLRLVSGGSYGHTCYVAKELSAITQQFNCFMATHFGLLDELNVTQELIQPPLKHASETDLLMADSFYFEALRPRLEGLRPAYLYERLCLGNFAVARLSRELGIPYIVEYNGSELSMRRSFGSGKYENEHLFLRAEELAFKQATAITVISERVRDDVISRGADPAKVLVNPNGVDCDEYAPPGFEQQREIRASIGLDDEPVVAFIGTFGGWHGIDVLAAALPKIYASEPNVRFLLIGDGNFKYKVLNAIHENGLNDCVIDVGRTEQRVGARLLKAANIFVSPHSSHMVDSLFFGSPTKLFEYMALGGGIVASDLEQLGVVMSPALRPSDFTSGSVRVRDERGVLFKPGDVDEFVASVLALVRNPDISVALGRNARAAALAHYSWRQHVARIWDHVLAAHQKSSQYGGDQERARED
jgi:glycosyltransferase involved in cell wall biosynthesis